MLNTVAVFTAFLLSTILFLKLKLAKALSIFLLAALDNVAPFAPEFPDILRLCIFLPNWLRSLFNFFVCLLETLEVFNTLLISFTRWIELLTALEITLTPSFSPAVFLSKIGCIAAFADEFIVLICLSAFCLILAIALGLLALPAGVSALLSISTCSSIASISAVVLLLIVFICVSTISLAEPVLRLAIALSIVFLAVVTAGLTFPFSFNSILFKASEIIAALPTSLFSW